MNFICDLKTLNSAISNVSLAVSGKSPLLAIEGILMVCKNSTLSLYGYNLDLGISTTIEADVKKEGSIVLNAKLLGDILRKVDSGTVSFSVDDKLLTTIKCGDAEFTILGIDSQEFPAFPAITGENSFNITNSTLKNMINQTLFAVAVTDQKPIHTGVLFDIYDNEISLVAVDGYRLALRREPIIYKDILKFVVPGKTLQEINKLLSDDSDDIVEVCVERKHISFKVKDYYIVSRLLEGDFLDYKGTISGKSSTRIKVNTKDFIQSVERASIIINDRAKSPIKCAFHPDFASISCITSIGKVNDCFNISTVEGEGFTIGFNNKYMLDALKATETPEIVLELNGPIAPIKIVPANSNHFLFLVLPVRLKND